MATATYTASGAKATTPAVLSKKVFAVEIKNHQLLKDAYLAFLANGRPNLAKTLKRGEVRGGGIKPWRQKGTGRARFGSIRNPIWRGGGIAFGPTGNQNYSRVLNSKAKRQALRQALTLAAKDDAVIIIDGFKTTGKVKDTLSLLNKLKIQRRVLFIVETIDDLIIRATNNLPEVEAIYAKKLTAFHVLNADKLVISKKALEILNDWLEGDKS